MSFNWSPLYNRAKDSIFFVMMTPIQDKEGELNKQRKKLAEAVSTTARGKERNDALAATETSTGFCVDVRGDEIRIITTAHAIDHLYTASKPLIPAKVNEFFKVEVFCVHYEGAYRQSRSNAERTYATATVVAINCATDLMLVTARLSDVRGYAAGGGAGETCNEPHPVMLRCGAIEEPTHECMMVSWPPYKPDMMSIGRIGTRRTVDEISRPNDVQYDVNVLEVQMWSGKGSSGAPLLNESGEVFGMLHGGHGGDQSYFICPWHIIEFLANNLNNPPPPPPAPPAPDPGASSSSRSKRAKFC